MRYLLVLMLLVVAVSVCHGEDSKTEYSVSLDTTKINMGQQVDQVADALKKHLDGPLGMYYKAAVARNRAMGIVRVVGGAGLLLLGFVLIGVSVKLYRLSDDGCEFGYFMGAILSTVAAAMVLIWGVVSISSSVELLVAPEYIAMQNILTNLRYVVH